MIVEMSAWAVNRPAGTCNNEYVYIQCNTSVPILMQLLKNGTGILSE